MRDVGVTRIDDALFHGFLQTDHSQFLSKILRPGILKTLLKDSYRAADVSHCISTVVTC